MEAMDKKNVEITVVIPTRNRAITLGDTLESIVKQTMDADKFEVIVVDNGSTDHTRDICESYQCKIVNFKYIYDPSPGLHVGRNRGLQESKGNIIVYADDDIIALPTWLSAISRIFAEMPEVALIGGNNYPKFEGEVPEWLGELWEERDEIRILSSYSCLEFLGENRYIDPSYVYGCNFAVRKKILLETKGFHPDGMPKEYLYYRGDGESFVSEFIKRNAYKAYYCNDASVYHRVSGSRMTLQYLDQISFRKGVSRTYTCIREHSFIYAVIKYFWDFVKPYGWGKGNCSDIIKRNRKIKDKGVRFYLKSYIIKPKMRKWIKQEDYLGENGRIERLC